MVAMERLYPVELLRTKIPNASSGPGEALSYTSSTNNATEVPPKKAVPSNSDDAAGADPEELVSGDANWTLWLCLLGVVAFGSFAYRRSWAALEPFRGRG